MSRDLVPTSNSRSQGIRCTATLAVAMGIAVCAAAQPTQMTITAYLDRSYYTTEDAARVIVVPSVRQRSLRGVKVLLKGQQGQTLAEGEGAARVELPIAIGELGYGRHRLSVEWIAGQSEMASVGLQLIKRPPKPGYEWKIDHVNRNLLRDGKPWFSIALCYGPDLGSRVPNDFRQDFFGHLKRAGIDTFVVWSNWPCHRDGLPANASRAEIAADYARVARENNLLLKGDREGVKVRLKDNRGYLAAKDVVLTTSWQRYWTEGTIGPNCRRNVFRVLIRPGFPTCTVWADAVQVEQGHEPTAYERGS